MLDRKLLRENPEQTAAALNRRGAQYAGLVERFLALDGERRAGQLSFDTTKAELNKLSQEIGTLMKAGQADAGQAKRAEAEQLKQEIKSLEQALKDLEQAELSLMLEFPNLPHESIPTGGEECAEVVKQWGEPREFGFTPRDHVELCDRLQLANFEAGARLAGGGFPVLTGAGALLQRALINLMLDLHIAQHGYTEIRPPFIVHPRCPLGTGQLPKFGDEMYHVYVPGSGAELDVGARRDAPARAAHEPPLPVTDGTNAVPAGPHFYLIPTAEVPVVNYYREQILEAPALPVKLCAYSPCWRVEGGSYGQDARGLTRLHQFEKVELVRLSDPERSWEDHEAMTAEAEAILELLGLPYRRKLLPSGDMALGSAKTYDLEVYCAAGGHWREVSSASNTTDWQARRANIRFRRERGGKVEYPHLLNASGLALPRLMIALIETYQTAEGDVDVPAPLRPYLHGLTRITPPEHGVPWL